MFRLAELYFAHVLFHIAIVAFADAAVLVDNVENGLHGLVVGDANWIVALHDAAELIRCVDGLLLNHFIVVNDVEHHFRRYHRESRDLLVGEELVGNLDDALLAHLLRSIVISDGRQVRRVEQPK